MSTCPEYIARVLLEEINKAVKNLVIVRKVQIKKYSTPYWTKKLEAERKQLNYLNKVAEESGKHEDARLVKNIKNRHKKNMKKEEKKCYTQKFGTHLGKLK